MVKYDIAIIGGGAVGLSIANLLANTSLKVILIEASDFVKKTAESTKRSIALSQSSINILSDCLLSSQIKSIACQIKTVHVSVAGKFGVSRIDANDFDLNELGFVISLSDLEKIFYDNVVSTENITLVQNCELNTLEESSSGWKLELSDKTIVESDLLVGADGANSVVKQCLGIKTDSQSYSQAAMITNVKHSLGHKNVAYERFVNPGAVAMLPFCLNTSTHVWTSSSDNIEELMQLEDKDFLKVLQDRFGFRLGKFISCEPRVKVPLSLNLASEQYGKNFILVGNSAHAIHPVAAQGFNLSLRDAYEFCRLVKREISLGNSICNSSIFEEYLRNRSSDQHKVITSTSFLVDFISNDKIPGSCKAIGLLSIDSLPWLKSYIAKLGMGLHEEFI